jgi:hypothetical protein
MSDDSGGASGASEPPRAVAAAAGAAAAAAKKNKGGRPPKPIWRYFERSEYDATAGGKRADGTCNFCHQVFPKASPATLEAHIAHECKAVEQGVRDAIRVELASDAPPLEAGATAGNRTVLKKRSIGNTVARHFGSAHPFTDRDQERFNFLLLRAFIDSGASFRMADNPFFLQWVDEVSSQRYTPAGMFCYKHY